MMSGREFSREEVNSIKAAVSGGLNTANSDLLIPLEDSPSMLNTKVDFDGMVRKRTGYRVVYRRNSASASYFKNHIFVPLQTVSGKPYIIRKEGTSLVVDIKDNNGWSVAWKTHANVFNSQAAQSKFYAHIQNEPFYSRIIFVNKNHVPVQLAYGSYRFSFTKGGSSVNWTGVELPVVFAAINSTNNFSVIVNGVLQTATYVSSSLTNNVAILAFDTSSSFAAGTYDLEIIFHTWQWWAESFTLKGAQIHQPIIQGTSTQTVSIPSAVLQGITSWLNGRPTMQMYSNSNYDNKYTATNPPTTVSQYWFSDGSTSGGVALQASPFFASFGATPSTTRTVYVHRGYLLPFYGGAGANLQAGALSVSPLTRTTNCERYLPSAPSEGGVGTGLNVAGQIGYYLRSRSTYLSYSSAPNTRIPVYITFDATATAQGGTALIGLEEIFQITDVNTADIITTGSLGSGVNTSSIHGLSKNFSPEFPPIPLNGVAYPAAGISWFSDYKRRSHPSVVGSIQGRLALGGFDLQPMTLVCSNVYDSIVPGVYSNNFDVIYTLPEPGSPFDLTLPSSSSDRITAMLEYNDSLFVFSLGKTYRIHNNGDFIDATNARYTVVADIGVPNANCVCLTDKFPVFLSPSGVYGLQPTDTETGYEVVEISAKIRNYIAARNTTLADVGFVMYDGDRQELYVALSDNVSTDRCGDMLVYNLRQDAWYLYSTFGGAAFHASAGNLVFSGASSLPGVWFCLPGSYNDDDNIMFVEMNQENVPFDQHERFVWNPGLPYSTLLPAAEYSTTAVSGIFEYDPTSISIGKEKAVRLSPIRDLQDVFVLINGVGQTFGTDYIKTDRGTIEFWVAPTGGATVTIRSVMLHSDGLIYHPVTVYNATTGKLYEPTERTVDISGNFYRLTGLDPAPTAGDILYIGYVYPSWYVTPTFNRGTLNVKRVTDYFGYLQNNVVDIWKDWESPYPSATDVGWRKANINLDVAVLFSNEYEGLVGTDLISNAPAAYPGQTSKDYTRISVPIIGGGYNIQVVHHNKGVSTFKLAGYELKAVPKPGKGYSKSEESYN